jgi:hypothetical protein
MPIELVVYCYDKIIIHNYNIKHPVRSIDRTGKDNSPGIHARVYWTENILGFSPEILYFGLKPESIVSL